MEENREQEQSLSLAQTYAMQLAMIIKGASSHNKKANYQTSCREFISALSENLSSVEELDEFRDAFNEICNDPRSLELGTISSKMGIDLEVINSLLDQCREQIEEKNKSSCVLF